MLLCKVDTTVIPKLQVGKLRLREVSQVSKLVRWGTHHLLRKLVLTAAGNWLGKDKNR